jgi:hypothetical protein
MQAVISTKNISIMPFPSTELDLSSPTSSYNNTNILKDSPLLTCICSQSQLSSHDRTKNSTHSSKHTISSTGVLKQSMRLTESIVNIIISWTNSTGLRVCPHPSHHITPKIRIVNATNCDELIKNTKYPPNANSTWQSGGNGGCREPRQAAQLPRQLIANR